MMVAGEEGTGEEGTTSSEEEPKEKIMGITFGANTTTVVVDGHNIGQIKKNIGDVLNIDPKAECYVGGNKVDDDYVPKPDEDDIEFIKPSGTKG